MSVGQTVKPAPVGSPDVRDGRAPAQCGACGGRHGSVNVEIACYAVALSVARASVKALESRIAADAADTERGRRAREAVEGFSRFAGSVRP